MDKPLPAVRKRGHNISRKSWFQGLIIWPHGSRLSQHMHARFSQPTSRDPGKCRDAWLQSATRVISGNLQPCLEKLGSSMNTQYEYQLPRGLSLRADSCVEGARPASGTDVLIDRTSSARKATVDGFGGPRVLGLSQHPHALQVHQNSGVSPNRSSSFVVIDKTIPATKGWSTCT